MSRIIALQEHYAAKGLVEATQTAVEMVRSTEYFGTFGQRPLDMHLSVHGATTTTSTCSRSTCARKIAPQPRTALVEHYMTYLQEEQHNLRTISNTPVSMYRGALWVLLGQGTALSQPFHQRRHIGNLTIVLEWSRVASHLTFSKRPQSDI